MSNSQDFNQTSNSTLAKLLEVDSQLADQEAQLRVQLQSVQEKRQSLKTVISLFTTADTPEEAPVEEPRSLGAQTSSELETVNENLAGSPLENLADTTAELETEASPDTQSNGAKKQVVSSTKGNKTTKITQTAKTGKKSSRWQDYVRAEFSNTSLPEAVFSVLQRQSDRVFEIAAIMNAIFVDELPAEVRTKARRQVTNILSAGAMKNKCYRGQLGQYSISKTAVGARS